MKAEAKATFYGVLSEASGQNDGRVNIRIRSEVVKENRPRDYRDFVLSAKDAKTFLGQNAFGTALEVEYAVEIRPDSRPTFVDDVKDGSES